METIEDKITKMKNEAEGWKESIMIRQEAYKSAKIYLKQKEKELKDSKRIVYLTYKQLREAKSKYETSMRRFKTYPYKIRRWAKEHMDKVWELMENEKS